MSGPPTEIPAEAQRLIDFYGMTWLAPEGGWFKRYYPQQDESHTNLPGSGIMLLHIAETVGYLHRLPKDEIWHFYLGSPATLLLLHPNGHTERVTLGKRLFDGQRLFYTVPAGVWQGVFMEAGGYALMGTTMAPAFAAGDYHAGDRATLISNYQGESALITKLTPPPAAENS